MALFDFLKKPTSVLGKIVEQSGLGSLYKTITPFVQKYPSPASFVASKASPLLEKGAQTVGKGLQQFPDLSINAPRPLSAGVPILGVPGLVSEQIRSYGRTLEDVSSAGGRKKLTESAGRVIRDPFKLSNLQEPAAEAALNLTDLLPGGLVLGGIKNIRKGIVKKGIKEVGERGIEKSVLQVLDNATGKLEFKTIKKGELPKFHELVDKGEGGIAGVRMGGKTYHLTAKTPEEMVAKGANFTGLASLEDVPKVAQETSEKYAFNVNIENLKTTEGGQQVLKETIEKIRPELEELKGKPLTHTEVLEEANKAQMMSKVVSRERQLAEEASLLKLRQTTTSISDQISKAGGEVSPELWKEYTDNLKALSSQASAKGRALESLKIGAEDMPLRDQFLQEMLKKVDDVDKVLEAAKGVDFNDARQANKFYRQFVKPSAGEVIDWFRYSNMLSSPKTAIINLFGNLMQAPLSVGEKLASGTVDAVASTLTGKQREYYVREVPHYVKGFMNSVPKAIKSFGETLAGKRSIGRPDINRVPPFTGKAAGAFGYGSRLLEAGDAFFRELFDAANKEALAYKAGRLGQEVVPEAIEKAAKSESLYRLFRKGLKEADQGPVLNWIDSLTSGVYNLRKVPGVGWIVPFVQTPMNILKQGIEYSPLGVVTIPGAKNKIPQLSKTIVGSLVSMGAAMLAMQGKATGSAPRGEKEKTAFYDSGMKPYSVRIGDQWVSYNKLGPLSYPIALAVAVKQKFEENPSDEVIANLGRALQAQLQFFSEQSYVEGIKNLGDILSGEAYAGKQLLASAAGQVIPLRALIAWANKFVDDVYRHPSTLTEMVKTQLPFLSKTVEPYLTGSGQPSRRQYNVFNQFSPIEASPANPAFEPVFQAKKQKRILQSEKKKAKAKTSTFGTPYSFR